MKFYHHTNNHNKGGCTLAYDIIHHEKGKKIVIAVAQVSKKDYYCKKTGRDIATARYLKGETQSFVIKSKKNMDIFLDFYATSISYLY